MRAIASAPGAREALTRLVSAYAKQTPRRIQLIDLFLLFPLLVAIAMAAYFILTRAREVNTFWAALFSCAGTFAITAALRVQLASSSPSRLSLRAIFCQFLVAQAILHFSVMNLLF